MATTIIKIAGMHCASCKALIEDVARDLPGVESCTVDIGKGQGVIEHDARFVFDDLAKEVASLGDYRVTTL